jgi:hypothetical protein
MTFEQFHVGLEVVLTVVIPVAVWSARRIATAVDRVADKKAAIIKASLDAHELKDEQRFEQHAEETRILMRKLDNLGEERQRQHQENQVRLAELATEMKGWRSWYEKWQQSKFGG